MRTKQVRPDKLDYEYELYISHQFDNTLKKNYILFDFRTTKVFENYIYKMNVSEKINPKNKKLDFNIEGLSAPIISIPKTGSAGYQYKYFDFKNSSYNLILKNQRKDKNEFVIKITKTTIKIVKQPRKKFIKIIISK
ncbi:MAG: hypothetical protein H8D45_00680 [Bacteroidetes bacterium]|nr:hypothetical protein [Bacteroidota bacterium]